MYEPGFCGAIKLSLRRTLVRQSIIQLLHMQQRLFLPYLKAGLAGKRTKQQVATKNFLLRLYRVCLYLCNQFFLFHVTQLLLLMLVVVLMPAAYFLICYL